MKDKIQKAYEIRQRGKLERNPLTGCVFVPSHTDPEREYMVSVDGFCNCDSRVLCCHAICAFDVHIPILQMRWAMDYSELLDVAEYHKEAICHMPERLRTLCRQEFIDAKERLQGEQKKAA